MESGMSNPREFENYKKIIKQNNLIILAPSGSELLGMERSDGTSDIDETGISVETPKQLLGFSPFEQDIYRTAVDRTGNVNEPSKSGDLDLTIYGLRKFVRLAMSGNPNIISLLFVPKNQCSVYTPLASDLQNLRKSFINKNMANAYLGYMQSQRTKLSNKVIRPANADRENPYGNYDAKYATHLVRLGMQGAQLMSTGRLEFPLGGGDLDLLRSIRSNMYTMDKIIAYAQRYENMIREYVSENTARLPERPDYEVIENWLISVYKKVWNENSEASQYQGIAPDRTGQDLPTSVANLFGAEDPIF
jgi:uncharacterized protein